MRKRTKADETAAAATGDENAKSAPAAGAVAAHAKRIKALEDRVDQLVAKLGGIIGTSVED